MSDKGAESNLDGFAEGDDPREQRVGELLNEFLDRRLRGEAVSEDQFLAANPDVADELRRHLDGLAMIDRLGAQADDATVALGTPRAGSSDLRERLEEEPIGLPEIEGYDLIREIGRGGMGIVFKAVQRSTKRPVALKVLLEGPFASEQARRRFEREIELAAQLRHPCIVPIYDSGRSGGRMYYAMEYVHGQALSEYVRTHALPQRDRLKLFLRICGAVSYANLRGVVHRDLKPANILVDADGEPRVHDFGLAKMGGAQDMTTSVTAQIIGTPAYMAPEQVTGDPTAVDPRTDVYSLGIILYELVTGRMPYPTTGALGQVLNHITQTDPERPSRLDRDVSSELEAILLKALAKRKDDRYQSVSALADDVSRYLAGEPIQARPAGALYLLGKALWPHRHLVAVVSLMIVLGGVGLVIVFQARGAADSQRRERQQLEMQLAAERLRAKEAELEAERKRQEELRLRDQQWAELITRRLQELQLPPDAGDRLAKRTDGLLQGLAPKNPSMLLTRTLGQGLEALGQAMQDPAAQSAATQPATQPAAAEPNASTTQQSGE
ncbi:MAG: protein kinase [Phycisphaerae bacterium]|nr:protein kinase [Phycisphaerae bacterium]